MKNRTIFVAAAAAALVSGQSLGVEPACAIPCFQSAIASAGCGATDVACQCGSGQAKIQSAVTPCLLSGCSPSDLQIAASVELSLCSQYSASFTSGGGSTASTATTGTSSAKPTSTNTPVTSSLATQSTPTSTSSSLVTSAGSSAESSSKSLTGASVTSSSATSTGESSVLFSSVASTETSGVPLSTTSTGASVVPSPTTFTTSASSSTSTGAKVGIALGVILVTAAVLLILLFLLRRRRRQLQEQRLEVPELPTKANRHELDSKGLETITEKPPEQGDSNTTSELPGQLPTQEQIAANTGIRNSGALVEIDTGPRTLSKDGKKEVVQDVMTGREATAPEFAGPTISTAPIVTPQMSTLEALQAKLDKIRTEKERLTKMQELEDMEAELQREIAQEQNRQRIVATEAAIHQSELP